MKSIILILTSWLLITQSVLAERNETLAAGGEYSNILTRIAFGSCAKEYKPQPILEKVAENKPDLFVFLGDNMYGDTSDEDVLQNKYSQFGSKPEFRALLNATDVIATWDDHDYGKNNAGRHFPFKEKSKEIFLDFWREPLISDRRKRKGIYADYMFGSEGKRVQILLLDTRSFRDDYKQRLVRKIRHSKISAYKRIYVEHSDKARTMLGKQQWRWLEEQLRKPADLRIIGSSTQFGVSHNGHEAWANMPHEQKKLANIISSTGANGVVFISGDMHYSETSRLKTDVTYPLYDFTSSGITQTTFHAFANKNRIDGPIMQNNYGMLEIDWAKQVIRFKVIDLSGEETINRLVSMSELVFK
ncbi:MAG: alkaline phosphatase family protein [Gammaproteobacteria bacterium]|nr:alkaline phosphatase family protein [Gammaproteobacteria bacterium]